MLDLLNLTNKSNIITIHKQEHIKHAEGVFIFFPFSFSFFFGGVGGNKKSDSEMEDLESEGTQST
jgi:hypothetical protein